MTKPHGSPEGAASNCRAVSAVSIGRFFGLLASLFACVAQDSVVKASFALVSLATRAAIAVSRMTSI